MIMGLRRQLTTLNTFEKSFEDGRLELPRMSRGISSMLGMRTAFQLSELNVKTHNDTGS